MILYISVVLFSLGTMSNVVSISHVNEIKRDVSFHIHTRQNRGTPCIMKIRNKTALANSSLHPKHPTVIYIHGFTESGSSESTNTIVKAYLERDDYNVIVVDWEALAKDQWYPITVGNTKKVGRHVANYVKWLQSQKRISISDLHVIGFSLGAHVAGFMGKRLKRQKVARITGLDPAAPGFTKSNKHSRLDRSDASFVDIIHVYAKRGKMGLRIPIGHADFYPNKGLEQPACKTEFFTRDTCNHRLAWIYYAESILNPHGFPASECEIWDPTVDNCTPKLHTFMGIDVNVNTRGIYLVPTNSKSPFAINSDSLT